MMSVSLPGALVTSEEKTPARPKRAVVSKARIAMGSDRSNDFSEVFRQAHAICSSSHAALVGELVLRSMTCRC